MSNISFSYPTWFIILCLLLGLIYAGILYFREQKFTQIKSWLSPLLAFLRFLGISLISMLLLSPLFKNQKQEKQDPVIVFAQDVSKSISNELDSVAFADYRNTLNQFRSDLSDKYDLKSLAFGSSVRDLSDTFSLRDEITNMSDLFEHIDNQFGNLNLGAVVIASDGIYNEGINPLYSDVRFKAPLHLIALGDTTEQKDLLVKRVYHNDITYLGDQFGIQVDIAANNCDNNNRRLRVSKEENGQFINVIDESFRITSNDYFQTFEFILDANQSGVNRYRISVSPIEGEITRSNNFKDIYIEVLDARQKVLILANAPHPDLSAFKQLISLNKNREVEVAFASDFNQNILDYELVIFHNLPSRNHGIIQYLEPLNRESRARLFVIGAQTSMSRLNNAQSLLSISTSAKTNNEVQALVKDNFNLFTISDELKAALPFFTPLIAPFGEFNLSPKTNVLLNQKIGKIDTDYPLICFGEEDNYKTGIFVAEGIWRWKLFDFLQNQNHNIIGELVNKSIQYVSVKEDRRKFRVKPLKRLFGENEQITFDAELYNNSYERIAEPDVFMVITNAEGEEFPLTFSKRSDYYHLDADFFPEGSYRYYAYVNYNGQRLEQGGRFNVQSIQLEMYDLQARHNVLNTLAEQFGDNNLYSYQNLDDLKNNLLESDRIKPVVYQSFRTRPVIHLKWLFYILLGLLGLEWFVRRYYGSY